MCSADGWHKTCVLLWDWQVFSWSWNRAGCNANISIVTSLSAIVNRSSVDFVCFCHLLLVSPVEPKCLASLVKTKALGVAHIYKLNPNCVCKNLLLKHQRADPRWNASFFCFCGYLPEWAMMPFMQIANPLENRAKQVLQYSYLLVKPFNHKATKLLRNCSVTKMLSFMCNVF